MTEEFNPNQPFEVVGTDGGFDPNQPFEVVEQPGKPRLSDRLDNFAKRQTFSVADDAPAFVRQGAEYAERGVDMVAEAGRDVLRAPFETLVVEPSKTITQANDYLQLGAAKVGSALRSAATGDREGARALANSSVDDFEQAIMGGLEGAALLAPAPSVGAVARRALVDTSPEGRATLDDFERTGIRPNITTVPSAENVTRQMMPVAENAALGSTMRRRAGDTLDDSEAAVERLADKLFANAGAFVAGRSARQGVGDFAGRRGDVYDKAFERIDGSKLYRPAPDELNEVRSAARLFDSDAREKLGGSAAAKRNLAILEAEDVISIDDLRKSRTSIRKDINEHLLQRGQDDAALISMRDRVTEMMHKAVRELEGEEALQGLLAADRQYARDTEKLRTSIKTFTSKTRSEGSLFKAIQTSADRDPKALRDLRGALNPEQWDAITAATLRDMSYTPDGFSPTRFATRWNKMAPASKNILFNRKGEGGGNVRKDVDALARIFAGQKRAERLRNFSNTAVNLGNAGVLAGITFAPVETISAVVGANVVGDLMMRPAGARMLLRLEREMPQIPQRVDIARAEAVTRTRALAIIAAAEQTDPSLRSITEDLRRAITNDNSLPEQLLAPEITERPTVPQ